MFSTAAEDPAVQFLAFELIAFILLFAVDDAFHDRPPAATWTMSFRVIAAAIVAMAAVALGQAAAGADLL
jgi:hypothetical protein